MEGLAMSLGVSKLRFSPRLQGGAASQLHPVSSAFQPRQDVLDPLVG